MKEKNYKEALMGFIKRYLYIVVLSIIMLVLSIILIANANKPQDNVTKPVNNDALTFYNPVMNFTVSKDYNDSSLVYNKTLKQWEAHKAIALTAAEDSDVYAVLDGVVEDVYSNYLNGYVVIIKHNDNLKTYYSSLAEDVKVKKGDKVSKGQVVGKVGTTANAELDLGTHLTFAVSENDVKIDPSAYLNLSDK